MHYLFLLIFSLLSQAGYAEEKTVIRVGHFPNLTHAQALIGHNLTREDRGWFEERLGEKVEVQWFVFNAGPSAMESIFTESIDLTYVGPSPTINAFLKSKGEEVRIISGSCSKGAALVVQADGGIKNDSDFKGKKIGTPQFGNTQDVAARSWLESIGLDITPTGGDAYVIPTSPSNQYLLFKTGELDAVWTIEPWVSRLVLDAKARIYFEESKLWPLTDGQYVTTHIVSRKGFLKEHPELVKKWLLAQVELTEWMKQNPEKAKTIIAKELKNETRIALPPAILERAWNYLEFTYDPVRASLTKYAREAYRIGFIKEEPDLEGIYDLQPLNEVLAELKKPPIP